MMYKGIKKHYNYLLIILCVIVVQWGLVGHSLATDDTVSSLKDGQSLTEISENILNLINQNQYESAREELHKLSAQYLSSGFQSEKTVEAHKAYAEQILYVKSELNKHQVDQMALLDRCLQLFIASEVYEGKDMREFSKRLAAFYQNAVNLRDIVAAGSSQDIAETVGKINADFTLLSTAIQIAYPPEYHNQLHSMIQYLNSQTKEVAKIKEVSNHLVTVLGTMHQHTQDTNARLMTAQMSAGHYIFGISAILAAAFLVVFRRKWQQILDTN